jgi:heme/copper-type cytochrome/quinol oxidase subunit 3
MILFVASEVMLFGGLLAGYVVLRFGSDGFAGMPSLPAGPASISTGVLLLSSATLIVATRAGRRGAALLCRRAALATLILGTLFMGLQIAEWNRLMGAGVLPEGNIHGGMFYVLSWAHALHVIGGLALLVWLLLRIRRELHGSRLRDLFDIAGIYWHFVTVVWGTLFLILFGQ